MLVPPHVCTVITDIIYPGFKRHTLAYIGTPVLRSVSETLNESKEIGFMYEYNRLLYGALCSVYLHDQGSLKYTPTRRCSYCQRSDISLRWLQLSNAHNYIFIAAAHQKQRRRSFQPTHSEPRYRGGDRSAITMVKADDIRRESVKVAMSATAAAAAVTYISIILRHR